MRGYKSLEERGMRVSTPKTQFMDFAFEQNEQGNRQPVNIREEELQMLTNFKHLRTSRRRRWYDNEERKASARRLEKLGEMQRSIVQHKDAIATGGEGLHNSHQTSNAIWCRNTCRNGMTRNTDCGKTS